MGLQVRTSSRDAFAVAKNLLTNPVGGLSAAYDGLGVDRALGAGVALCVGVALTISAGIILGANQLLGQFYGFFGAPQGLGDFFKLALGALVVPGAIALVTLAIRKMMSANPPFAADVFTAGASLTPLALATLLGGLVGIGNFEIVLILLFFGFAYLLLMLYAGLTSIGGITHEAGAPAVPTAVLLAGWLAKTVFVSLI